MYWHDYKTEKPTALTVCLVEFDTVDHKPSYRIASYFGEHETPWAFDKGWFNDGKMVLRWIPLADILENIKDESNSFVKEAQDNANDFRDRLAIEYWQLTNRIEKFEKTLNMFEWKDEDTLKLLYEQRDYMLKYKDVLFRRICHHNIKLYKEEES